MTAALPTSLPYGVRDCKLTGYLDAAGQVLGPQSIDLPYMQTLNFSETEEFQEMRGDDKVITTRGRGSEVAWYLEAGGMSTQVWAQLSGGDVIERGLAPFREIEIQKRSTQTRPWFRIDGRIVSDSGGDVLVRIYRCRANDNIQANFADGEFTTTSVSGVGYPLLDETNDLLYSIFRRETAQALTLTPTPNPVQAPLNLTAGAATAASIALTWTPVVGATKYGVYYKKAADASFTKFATEPTSANQVVNTLTAATPYDFQVTAFVGGVESDPCPKITASTTA